MTHAQFSGTHAWIPHHVQRNKAYSVRAEWGIKF